MNLNLKEKYEGLLIFILEKGIFFDNVALSMYGTLIIVYNPNMNTFLTFTHNSFV